MSTKGSYILSGSRTFSKYIQISLVFFVAFRGYIFLILKPQAHVPQSILENSQRTQCSKNPQNLTFLVNFDFYEKKCTARCNGNGLRIVFRDTFVQNRLPTNTRSGTATWKHSSNRSHHLLSRERNKREDYRQRRRKNASLF